MANEITVALNVVVRKGNLSETLTANFKADQDGVGGPTPGVLSISTAGEDITLTDLVTPGLCVAQNVDSTNYIELGVHDGTLYHPSLELQPCWPWRRWC